MKRQPTTGDFFERFRFLPDPRYNGSDMRRTTLLAGGDTVAEVIGLEAWERLARRLSAEAKALDGQGGTPHQRVAALLHRLSDSPDLAEAAKAAQELDGRYRPRQEGTLESLTFLGRIEAGAALGAFIGRSGVAKAVLSGEHVRGECIRTAFLEASRPRESGVEILVVLDGLELDSDSKVRSEYGPRLRRLDSRALEEFFEGDILGDISAAHLNGLAALEFTELATNPPWTTTTFELGSLAQRVRRKAWPWIAYVNLFSQQGFVQPVAVYRKSDSLICSPAVRTTVAGQPVWQPHFVRITDDEWEESEEPFISVRADSAKLMAFIDEMETARRKAAAKGHRADTALRLFVRYAESTRRWSDFHATDDVDVVDRSIVDGATLLEAVTLSRGEQGKGEKMASRLAALLSGGSQADRASLAAEIKHAYGIRSDLVHADQRPDQRTLTSVAALLARVTKPALVAFLRAGGSVQDVQRCATDASHAAYMRTLAALPGD